MNPPAASVGARTMTAPMKIATGKPANTSQALRPTHLLPVALSGRNAVPGFGRNAGARAAIFCHRAVHDCASVSRGASVRSICRASASTSHIICPPSQNTSAKSSPAPGAKPRARRARRLRSTVIVVVSAGCLVSMAALGEPWRSDSIGVPPRADRAIARAGQDARQPAAPFSQALPYGTDGVAGARARSGADLGRPVKEAGTERRGLVALGSPAPAAGRAIGPPGARRSLSRSSWYRTRCHSTTDEQRVGWSTVLPRAVVLAEGRGPPRLALSVAFWT